MTAPLTLTRRGEHALNILTFLTLTAGAWVPALIGVLS